MVKPYQKLEWIEALKAFAILGILLNHLVEEFGFYPWFSNPSYDWPSLTDRLQRILPPFENLAARAFVFLGWLGDMGPGIFILLSGFTLTYSALRKKEKTIVLRPFYLRRLNRILPLYVLIHLIILYTALFAGKPWLTDLSPKVLISLSGLRLTDGLFFFINPSWWFIALILQFYILFPMLYRLLTGTKLLLFAGITLGFTLCSRGLGLLDMTYSNNLYFWMTGIFFGTRLFEFTAGMILARVYISRGATFGNIPGNRLLAAGTGIYFLGFLCSLFYVTTLFSNMLITLGLGSLFLACWQLIQKKFTAFKKPLVWIGVAAFPVFLLHQPLMQWIAPAYSGMERMMVLSIIVIAVFPVARSLELFTNKMNQLFVLKTGLTTKVFILLTGVQILTGFIYFGSTVYDGNYGQIVRIIAMSVTLIHFYVAVVYFLNLSVQTGMNKSVFHACIGLLGPFVLFVLPQQWFGIYWLALIMVVILFGFTGRLTTNPIYRTTASLLMLVILVVFAEYSLRRFSPVEVGSWGELPALQIDSQTVYGLIPSRTTHLRYNNYSYSVHTNTMGLNGPELIQDKTATDKFRIFILGDAFTMPEGLPYSLAYAFRLETLLNQANDEASVEVVNGGVTGYGPNEMLGALRKYLPVVKPQLLINQLFINEFQEINLGPAERYKNIGLNPPPTKIRLFGSSQMARQLLFFTQKILKSPPYRKYLEDKSLVSFYRKDVQFYSSETLNRMDQYLQAVIQLCDEANIRLLFLLTPGQLEISQPGQINYYPYHLPLDDSLQYDINLPMDHLVKLCESHRTSFIDLREPLRNVPLQPVYFEASWHWNEAGHEAVATHLANAIRHSLPTKNQHE